MPVIYAKNPPKNKRPDRDVFLTPQDLADAAVAYVVKHWLSDATYRDPGHILDTGAGTGRWGLAWRTYTNAGLLRGIEVRGLPKPEVYDEWWSPIDYLTCDPGDMRYSIIMGNPPFVVAEEFIRKSLGLLAPQGVLCYLLPSEFQHGQGRGRGLFTEHPPADVVSLMQRPNFDGMGDNNTDVYILMIWTGIYDGPPIHSWLDWKATL